MAVRSRWRGWILLLLACTLVPSKAQIAESYQVAKVLSVRDARHSSFPTSRYPTTPYHTVDLAVQLNGQTYCIGYETPVLNEVHDLLAANGQNIQVALHGKTALLIPPAGRQLKAELVKSSQC